MRKEIKAVIFDLDGVITDTAVYHYKAWKRLADDLGVYFDEKMNENLKGIDRMTSLEMILSSSDKIFTANEKNILADRKNGYYRELIEGMTPLDILPGAVNTLEKLRSLGVKTGLASVSKNAFTVLEKLEIGEFFDFVADAAQIKRGKPDPEIFLTVAQMLGVESAFCIGVEDAQAGIEAIKSAGMYAVGIGAPEGLRGADDVIGSLDRFDIDKYAYLFENTPS